MKRYLIPAVIVVDIEDHETEVQAENKAAAAANAGNVYARNVNSKTCIMLDEKLPNKLMPVQSGETEIPGSYDYE